MRTLGQAPIHVSLYPHRARVWKKRRVVDGASSKGYDVHPLPSTLSCNSPAKEDGIYVCYKSLNWLDAARGGYLTAWGDRPEDMTEPVHTNPDYTTLKNSQII
jgi:hypothetical protein